MVQLQNLADNRKGTQVHKSQCKLRLEVLFITSNFKQAANLERSEIRRLRPAFNQIVNSASGMLGYRHAADSCRKMSETKLLHPMPEASREILRIINTGKRMAKEIKAKISKKLQGRTLPDEHKRKIGFAQEGPKNHRFGKKHTENTKRKMRKAHAVTWADPILSAEIVARRNKTRKFNQQTNKEKSYDEGRL